MHPDSLMLDSSVKTSCLLTYFTLYICAAAANVRNSERIACKNLKVKRTKSVNYSIAINDSPAKNHNLSLTFSSYKSLNNNTKSP